MELKAALNGTKPVLVEFYADWCHHCRKMKPIVADLKERTAGTIEVIQIDGERNTEEMKRYGFNSYPSWIIFKDGREQWRDSGEKSLTELEETIGHHT